MWPMNKYFNILKVCFDFINTKAYRLYFTTLQIYTGGLTFVYLYSKINFKI